MRQDHEELYILLLVVDDIMTALLPEDAQEEIPVGFAIVGHVGKSHGLSIKSVLIYFQHT